MALNGYIKLHRKMQEWGWYKDSNTKSVFLHLLLNANFKENYFKGHKVLPGQVVIGRKQMAEDLGLTEQNIRTALNHLKSTNEITITPTNKFSIITIEKWADYQLECDELTNKSTNNLTINQPTTNQQLTTTEECKERKNEKKYTYGCFGNVFLTEEEYESLKAEFTNFKGRIDALSEYMESTGRKYKSHYATIKAWARKEPKEIKPKSHKAFKEEYYERDDFKSEQMPEEVRQRLNTIGKVI